MKHVFTIHSPITFLAAFSVVENLKLDRKDVILISSKYKVPVEGFKVVRSFNEQYASNLWQKLRYFNVPASFDRYINAMTNGESFIAYVDLMSYYQRILITHTNCQQFHFIEEGNSTYQEFDDLSDITWHERSTDFRGEGMFKSLIRVLRGYNLRLLGVPYIYSAYTNMEEVKFYVLSSNAYFNAPNEKKVIVRPNPESPILKRLSAEMELKDQVIWIDGSGSRYTGLPDQSYEQAIQRAIHKFEDINIHNKTIYVKLRPGIINYDENTLIRVLKRNNLNVTVLPDNIILECLFMRSKDCHVFGTLTSALEYAYIFGHNAYSIYGLFAEQPTTFFDRMTGFWNNVVKLEA